MQGHFSLPQANQSLGLEAVSTFEELVEAARSDRPDLPASLSTDGTVTIVFTDIVDSTLMLSRLGDTAWVEVIRRHNGIVEEVTAAHGGTVVETQGDGSMLAFSSARRAVACSQAIQNAIDHAFADLSPPIRVRIGIHTGDAIHEAEHFFGTTVHYAARVAEPGCRRGSPCLQPGSRARSRRCFQRLLPRGPGSRAEGTRGPTPPLHARPKLRPSTQG